ncbi:response regulator transcription factor [Bacillus sp. 165]|uniref:response regulator transcription factor n=1 Tax=Bacillus sp. 165 TaxID=1529117 RepID=UPI001ADB78C7|nr:response regulator transcription factor [Bacillus sp. 165]MBO9131468.1 response regulator transcription factor [Bacillus sp. 165]
MKILVVDDDVNIQKLVSIHLSRKGYQVIKANHGEEALKVLEGMTVDLAVVDVMMPGMNGFELTKILSEDYDIPVILLTAKGQLDDKEKGFLSGSEDYIVKPFEVKELLYRVAVVLRRVKRAMETVIKVGNVVLDRNNFEVMINQETILFPLKEFEILSILASRIQRIAPRALLIEQIWGSEYEGSEQTLNTHINRIRDRLKKYEATVEVQTVRGIGYKLEVL